MEAIKFLALTICVFACTSIYAQKTPEDYFQEGCKLYEQSDYRHALASFNHIVNRHPRNELFPKSYYNAGSIYFEMEAYDSAIVICKNILLSNFNEKENLGGDIMADPYANYRHRAAEMLSEIYFKRQQYNSSLHYFAISDTVYPYITFCGNEYRTARAQTAIRYAQIYEKLKKRDLAIAQLLPYALWNEEAMVFLSKLIKNKKNLSKKLERSIDEIYTKGPNVYYMAFLGKEFEIYFDYDLQVYTIQEMKDRLRQTEFYKMINSL